MKTKHIFIAVLATTGLMVGMLIYFSLYRPAVFKEGELPQAEVINPPPPAGPSVTLTVKDSRTLIVRWQNLPEGTTLIEILRARLGSADWRKWKTVRVSGNLASGSAELTITDGSNPSNYTYTFRATDETGQEVWNTSSTPQTASTSTVSGSTTTVSGAGGSSTSTGGGTPTSTATSTQPKTGGTSTSSQNQGSGESTSTIIYYTPKGEISTSTAAGGHTESFWVEHVQKRIEIGWQKMPTGTVKIAVSRSLTGSGPWSKLLEQKGPFENTPYVIRLLDNTITNNYYYKLDASAAPGNVLQTFGPIFLPALVE